MLHTPVSSRFLWLAPIGMLALIFANQANGWGKRGCCEHAPRSQTQLVWAGETNPTAGKLVITDRHLVNTKDKDIALDFSVEEGKEKNILWKERLGDLSYAGPVVAGGKVFVCTNNRWPRDAAEKGDCGIVMCFDAKSGKFLWQAVH